MIYKVFGQSVTVTATAVLVEDVNPNEDVENYIVIETMNYEIASSHYLGGDYGVIGYKQHTYNTRTKAVHISTAIPSGYTFVGWFRSYNAGYNKQTSESTYIVELSKNMGDLNLYAFFVQND